MDPSDQKIAVRAGSLPPHTEPMCAQSYSVGHACPHAHTPIRKASPG
jgi:hypothetical protein